MPPCPDIAAGNGGAGIWAKGPGFCDTSFRSQVPAASCPAWRQQLYTCSLLLYFILRSGSPSDSKFVFNSCPVTAADLLCQAFRMLSERDALCWAPLPDRGIWDTLLSTVSILCPCLLIKSAGSVELTTNWCLTQLQGVTTSPLLIVVNGSQPFVPWDPKGALL